MDLGLSDRVYIVTGGSRGLGRATAGALVADGARVVVSGRDPAAADKTAAELGPGAVGTSADNADPAAPEQLLAQARNNFGRFDGALISVGGPSPGTVMDTPDDAWRDAFERVFLGAVRLVRELAAGSDDRCSFALVLSTSVRAPIPALATSNGLRPGLGMLVKQLADELGPRGIRVNGLLPGRVATDRVAELDARAGDADQVRAGHTERIPLRRYGEPDEFGRVAAFVLSPAASYVTGSMIPVDGGATRAL